MAAKLFRPDSAIDPVNDGRHTLPDRPLMRESIPYCVVMPKVKIALFTYTWVNKDSVAGAAFGVWGPGVGGEAITGYLPDRHVPDRTSVVSGTRLSVPVDFGGGRLC